MMGATILIFPTKAYARLWTFLSHFCLSDYHKVTKHVSSGILNVFKCEDYRLDCLSPCLPQKT